MRRALILMSLVGCSKAPDASPVPSASVSAAVTTPECKKTEDCANLPFVAVCHEGHCKKVFDECRDSTDCSSMPFSAECVLGHCKKRQVDETPVGGTCKKDDDCASTTTGKDCCSMGCNFRYGSKAAIAELEKRCDKERETNGLHCEGLGLRCSGTNSSRCKDGQCVKW